MAIENKSEMVVVRLTPTQADLFRRAADQEGFRLSAWLREVAQRAARRRVGQK
jgi:uncharacterized protein (DUF1778 family)